MPNVIVESPLPNIEMLTEYQQDAMCRTIIGSIRRLLEDERNRADFEQWKKARKQMHQKRRAVRPPAGH